MNNNKIILDLCGGTGSWSKPYADAGYTVYNITLPEFDVEATDIKTGVSGKYITFHDDNNRNRLSVEISDIYGILAAPPCTMFSDARTNAKTPRDLRGGFSTVKACMRIIEECMYHTVSDQQKYSPLKFWALENPWYGRLKWFLGNPVYSFNPWEFGHNYKKKTALWGYFKEPVKTHAVVDDVMSEEDLSLAKTNSRKLPKFDRLTIEEIKAMDNMAGSKKQLNYWKNTKTRQAMRSITPSGFAEAFFKANK